MQIAEQIEKSTFFKTHEVVGSSLLFVYDLTGNVGVWLIDFAKTSKARQPLSHRAPWIPGNQEDGYLFGLDTLIDIWKKTDVSNIVVPPDDLKTIRSLSAPTFPLPESVPSVLPS